MALKKIIYEGFSKTTSFSFFKVNLVKAGIHSHHWRDIQCTFSIFFSQNEANFPPEQKATFIQLSFMSYIFELELEKQSILILCNHASLRYRQNKSITLEQNFSYSKICVLCNLYANLQHRGESVTFCCCQKIHLLITQKTGNYVYKLPQVNKLTLHANLMCGL